MIDMPLFRHRLTVRFRDCDAMGHVNHAVYFTYMEQCRFALWRQLGGGMGLPGAGRSSFTPNATIARRHSSTTSSRSAGRLASSADRVSRSTTSIVNAGPERPARRRDGKDGERRRYDHAAAGAVIPIPERHTPAALKRADGQADRRGQEGRTRMGFA